MRIPHHLTIIGAAFGATVGAIGMGLLGAVVFGGTINAIISAAMGASTGAIIRGTILGAIMGVALGAVMAVIIGTGGGVYLKQIKTDG